jgi:hypothetical protein
MRLRVRATVQAALQELPAFVPAIRQQGIRKKDTRGLWVCHTYVATAIFKASVAPRRRKWE